MQRYLSSILFKSLFLVPEIFQILKNDDDDIKCLLADFFLYATIKSIENCGGT